MTTKQIKKEHLSNPLKASQSNHMMSVVKQGKGFVLYCYTCGHDLGRAFPWDWEWQRSKGLTKMQCSTYHKAVHECSEYNHLKNYYQKGLNKTHQKRTK